MTISYRLIILNFLQFFVWGAWLISIGNYLGGTLHFSGTQIGAVFSTLGIASLIMPALMGIVADKWLNAERLLGVCHLSGSVLLLIASTITEAQAFFWLMLLNSMAYMPTIALNNSVSYHLLAREGIDIVKKFPAIRVWGTVGFVVAMWLTDLMGWATNAQQLRFAAGAAFVLGLYAFSLPACPPSKNAQPQNLLERVGLNALVLFKQRDMLVFFLFAMFLGAALQITNAFGSSFLDSFAPSFPDAFVVRHANIMLSISQLSETLFILTIPFFLQKFGIKTVMLMSMLAWVLRFGLFAFGNPADGLPLLILSMIVYGMAFDFFNISGSLFVEQTAPAQLRASAQGLFMLMSNGVGAMIGGYGSGLVVDYFSDGAVKDWQSIWLSFALYALVLSLVFPFVFNDKSSQA